MRNRLLCFCIALLMIANFFTSAGLILPRAKAEGSVTVVDSASRTMVLDRSPRVVFTLTSSLTDVWRLAGGKSDGVTSDALTGQSADFLADAQVIGTVKEPNLELILSAHPDFVILSTEIASHQRIASALAKAGIPNYSAKIDTLDDYLKVLGDLVQVTGNADCYIQNGLDVKQRVEALLAKLPKDEVQKPKTAIFLRATASGVTAIYRDHMVCNILEDIRVKNLASDAAFPMGELSMEALLSADPDYIFWVAMGDEKAAGAYLEQSLFTNPTWARLRAVSQQRVIMLPKDLYQFKPNDRWDEAYETILKIVYPETYR